ncbi:hypothetical protein [Deinococcus sp.]|uniref:AfsR/SARP family transcriptional regulator n=1 Tax=Deinococcus sp. TaxID=47478 RepID=UPI003C7A9198
MTAKTTEVGGPQAGRGPGGVERRRGAPFSPPPGLQVRLLDGLELVWEGQELPISAPRLRALLAYLALEGASSRETLRGLLWPDLGSQPLRQALHALRQLPGADDWLQTDGSVRLRAQTDVQTLRRQLLGGEGPVPLDRRPRLLPDLDLESVSPFQDWLDEQRRQLGDLWREALQGELRRAGGADLERARRAARHLLSLDATDEATTRYWMRLEAAAGDLERCAEIFAQCRAALHSELGAEPGEETLALMRELEGQSAARDQPGRWLSGPGEGEEPLLGRESELEAAQEHLHTSGRVLLHGLAGIGKTRLAQALGARRAAGGGRVLWLTLGDDPPESVLPRLLELLGVGAAGRPLPDLALALRRALAGAGLAGLILDDAWNSHTVQLLGGALPAGLPVILTSRQRQGGWPRVSLDRLERPASLKLLRDQLQTRAAQVGAAEAGALDSGAGQPGPPATMLDALCALLGDHPYALRLAARTLQSGGVGIAALLATLGQVGGEAPSGESAAWPGSPSIAALLRQSVEALSEEAHEAYLGLGALPSPASSPELLSLLIRRPPEATEAALFQLLERGLVTRHARQGSELTSFAMHDLTWQSARQTPAYLTISVLRAAAAYAQDRSADPDALHLDLPNLLGAARLAEKSGRPEILTSLMLGILGGTYLATHGFPAGGLPLLQAAATAAAARQDWAAAARLHGKLGDVHQALLGDLASATDCYLIARDHAGQAGLTVLQATCTALAGTMLAMRGNLEKAGVTLQEALGYAHLSHDPLCLARVQEQGGIVNALQKDFTAAREALREARATLAPLLDRSHPRFQEAQAQTLTLTLNLGQAEQRLGCLPQALALKREALDMALERGEQVRVAKARQDVAEVLGLMGDQTAAARAELLQAASLYRELGATVREQEVLAMLSALPA